MPTLPAKLLLIGSLTTLAACSGSASDGDGGDSDDAQSQLFYGSTDPAASRSGLVYANDASAPEIDDLEEQTHTVRVARIVTNTDTGVSETIISDEVLTIAAGGRNNLTITLDAETLTFVDDIATRADGTNIQVVDMNFIADFIPQYVALKRVAAIAGASDIADDAREDEDTFVYLATGFETNPDAIAAVTTGSVNYAGDIQGGNDTVGGTSFITGSFAFAADFATSTVSGEVALTNFQTDLGKGTVNLDLASATITGNGFAGDLTIDSCSFGTCTGGGDIGGVFYGPEAEEIGGIMTIDITATDSANDSDQVNGVAGFIGAEVEPD